MSRLLQTLWLFISASLLVHAQIDLDDPEIRKKIIAQAVEVTWEKKADGTTVFYEPFTRSPYKGTGWVVIYYDDGIKLNALIQFKGGKRNGLESSWHENGQKSFEGNYKDGKKEGETQWYENGQVKAKFSYQDGKIEGLAIFSTKVVGRKKKSVMKTGKKKVGHSGMKTGN